MNHTITPKQHKILILIFRLRFLDRTNIQSLLQHKDKRRINYWLKDLSEKGYLHRHYDKKIIGRNRISAIYSLAALGIRYLKTQNDIQATSIHKRYYDRDRSDTFLKHCILVATICAQLERKTTQSKKYEYVTPSDISNTDNMFHFLQDLSLSFDLAYKKTEKRKKTKYYCLNILDETLPKYRMRKRIRDLHAVYISNDWEDNLHVSFPTLFFVCENKALLIYAKRYTKQVFEIERLSDLEIYFSTAQDVKDYGVMDAIWEGINNAN